jgi:hypothetical protein
VLLTPAIVRRIRRRSRLKRLSTDPDATWTAWSEVRDTAQDIGWSVANTETPRGFAERLALALTTVAERDALERLLVAVERNEFGPPGPRARPASLADDVSLLIRALKWDAGRLGSVRATLLPVSLLPQSWLPSNGALVSNA